ncbi:MAG TPA: RND family transporter, partial [Dongiaceae bacterium]|nr:RND family transporter [Dongiaceae bacterium]
MGNVEQGTPTPVPTLREFDLNSGNLLERIIFNHRLLLLAAIACVTLILGYMAVTRLELKPGFEKMIPQNHPYVRNFMENRAALRGLGNSVRVVVETMSGDIFDPRYMSVLKQVNDELFLAKGVDRAWMKSLWTPSVRWTEVTEEGFQGGPVMPDNYDGS